MIRNLDLTSLRSFVTVAETGGVTRAATSLHLTQSAVSMQLKRLEEALNQPLLDRSGRGIALTSEGEQLLSYARRMLALNDEAMARMTDQAYQGEVRLGVPGDIVYPYVPQVLKRFDREYPRVRVNLVSSYTRDLKKMLASGDLDLCLTTETHVGSGGETLSRQRMLWVGAPGGTAWRERPIRLAFERNCLFKPWVQKALDEAGIPWEMAVDTGSTRTVEASVSADLGVHSMLEAGIGSSPLEPICHGGALPALPSTLINMYISQTGQKPLTNAMADLVRGAYGASQSMAAE